MTKLDQSIIDNAPEGATHWLDGNYYKRIDGSFRLWSGHFWSPLSEFTAWLLSISPLLPLTRKVNETNKTYVQIGKAIHAKILAEKVGSQPQDSEEVKSLARELFVKTGLSAADCWHDAREFYKAGLTQV